MKLNKIAVAVTAAMASHAYALAPSVTPDVVFQISGATAADKQVQTYYSSLCDISTQDNYSEPGDDASAVFCTVRASTGVFSEDKDVLFLKQSGGSIDGVAPVVNQSNVVAIDLTTCSQTVPGTATSAGEYDCTGTTDRPAMVGISDVEPELFTLSENNFNAVPIDIAAATDLNVNTVNAQTFGIVVSPGLRDALQFAQDLSVGSDEVQNMPSLSSDLIANIFAGNVQNWSDLKGKNGGSIVSEAGATLSNGAVNVCVRTPGSGTQAQFNSYYMGTGCAYRGAGNFTSVALGIAVDSNGIENDSPVPTIGPFPAPGPHVHRNAGSSDMGRCLTNITNADRWAIGIQSLEKVDEGRTNRNEYKYVAIDGVKPTLENVASGLYQNWAALTIQWRTGDLTADQTVLADEFVRIARNINDVRDFNISLQTDDPTTTNDDRPAGGFNTPEILATGGTAPANVGSLVFAQGSTQPSFPFDATNPVMPFNKGLTGQSSCRIPAFNANGIDVSTRN
ncbi:MAG: substrate-binding domain-containing protein [Pseudomonadota bacterium]|nr:substrate-binding domain-containing protein [Pseudomonadota bacterium]